MTPSEQIIDAAIALAWSHWTALGIAGVSDPPTTAVDLESLILFTAALGDRDPRLRDEVSDWAITYGHRFVSLARLRNLLARTSEETRAAFDRLAAVVNAQGRTRWPSNATARPFKPSHKSHLDDLSHPALALLRLRCIFGITARAEILLAMLTQRNPQSWTRASELAELGYGKRNTFAVLEDLAFSRLVEVRKVDNANGYRLRNAGALQKAMHPLPLDDGRWHLRLPLLGDLVQLASRVGSKKPVVQAVEARSALAEQTLTMARLGETPPSPGEPDRYWAEVCAWILERLVAVR